MIGPRIGTEESDGIPRAMPNRFKFAHFPYLADALQQEMSQSRQGLRILDVGCGPGDLAAFCRPIEKCQWIGIDLWYRQLQQAKEKGVYEYVLQGNLLEGLPFRNESIDVVICSEVLMYLPNVPYMLAEFCRVMRTGGKLFVYNAISYYPRLASVLKRWGRQIYHESGSIAFNGSADWRKASRPTRISYYSFNGLISEIALLNFHIVHVTGFRIFRNRIRFLNRLEKYPWYGRMTECLTTRYPQISSELMVVARKGEARSDETS
ncbi:MAG: class I SAM-dependent methyltransferase [Desulfomonile tiedjei]|uniref:Class I SAM-dependent methyltransferase n=1 Tax=Desulfomonile tiedjei TaxID=2358 RepID=A0A9D6V117_9BACT|nr:class I SAM-dependent methyltransferase [Desulfomonile tiedjei]